MDALNYILLFSFAFIAGFIDSVVGGGGLIQLPAMLIFFPALSVPSLMGTNKFAAFSGTTIAAIRYSRETEVPWKSVWPAVATALIFSFLGAHVISAINKDYIKLLVLVLLIAVMIYTVLKKNFGLHHAPRLDSLKTIIYSLFTGAVLGFYDGFFGPGTGSFLIIIFISLFGFNFLIASASSKIVNCATNISALCYFVFTNQVHYEIAIPVAIFNMSGSYLGSTMAIKKGSIFVRSLFIIIVSTMIVKFAYDIFK